MYFKVCSCPKRDKQKEEQIVEQQKNGGVQYKRRAEDRKLVFDYYLILMVSLFN